MSWFSKVFEVAEPPDWDACKLLLEEVTESHPTGDRTYLKAKDQKDWFCVGTFTCPTLGQLREEGKGFTMPGKLVVTNVLGDVAEFHAEEKNRNATFQVASQFNCLEFASPTRTPEDGITGYVSDRTQGPACSIACGPATAHRNYFAQLEGCAEGGGQRSNYMIDNLVGVGKLLGNDAQELWDMQGGYSMADDSQLERLNARLLDLDTNGKMDDFRALLRIGMHADVEVTATRWGASRLETKEQLVTQVFGSACAVAYNRSRAELWENFATVILEASYEATLWAAVLATQRHGTQKEGGVLDPHGANIVYLTALGGGVFGNSMDWIDKAMRHAFKRFEEYDLDIRIVTYAGAIPSQLGKLAEDFKAV